MAAKLKDIGAKLCIRRHDATGATVKWLQAVVRGFFQYHAVPGSERRLWAFRKHVQRQWLPQLQRRSQRSRWTWERFHERLGNLLPPAGTLHPFRASALTPGIQGRNRVRELRQHGSVRGVSGNRHPYRDPWDIRRCGCGSAVCRLERAASRVERRRLSKSPGRADPPCLPLPHLQQRAAPTREVSKRGCARG
jgi:hypothetical protein